MPAVITRRLVIVTRPTEYDALIARHATRAQARFFLQTRDQDLDVADAQHAEQQVALDRVATAIPVEWRRARVDRSDLDRFLFGSDDVVVVVGQDGLVANVAKYLQGQPVIGVNPAPTRIPGVLVPHPPHAVPDLLADLTADRARIEPRTMVRATLDDGQYLLALNEVFVGHRSHQSARYELRCGEQHERHSSSGLIVASGTGASGWARSIHRERSSQLQLPHPTDDQLAFFVREAWPSITTGTSCTEGLLAAGQSLTVRSQMDQGGVLFGDGIEQDALEFPWGAEASLRRARRTLQLVAR